MNEMLEEHRTECAARLDRLLLSPVFPFDDSLKSRLPEEHGLYVITRKNESGQVEYLHAGRSHKAPAGLRDRVWNQHFWGGGKGAGSDLVQKVIDNLHAELGILNGPASRETRGKAQEWIRNNCLVQWVVEENPDLRCWAEHYMLSILRPIWGR